MNLIDSHAHLNFSDFGDDLEKVILDARSAGIAKIINIGTSLEDSREAVLLTSKYDCLYATIGIHPNDNPEARVNNIKWQEFEDLARHEKVVAIGECGLDFSRSLDKERQFGLFEKQIDIATKLDLPLSIHIRDAQEDLISSFGHKLASKKGVFHCFSGDLNYLNTILNLMPGFYVSFAGNITFKSALELRELVKAAPIERILIETDAPFLTPEPYRGKRNDPQNVKITAERVSETKGISLEEVAKITTQNTESLFGI